MHLDGSNSVHRLDENGANWCDIGAPGLVMMFPFFMVVRTNWSGMVRYAPVAWPGSWTWSWCSFFLWSNVRERQQLNLFFMCNCCIRHTAICPGMFRYAVKFLRYICDMVFFRLERSTPFYLWSISLPPGKAKVSMAQGRLLVVLTERLTLERLNIPQIAVALIAVLAEYLSMEYFLF